MADTFTPILNLCRPEIDQSKSTWGQKLNADLDVLDQFAGTTNTFIAGNDARIAALIAAAIPRGVIVAWTGAANNIPAGWYLCNGTNGTPNLTDRFILGNTGTRTNWEAGGSFGTAAVTDAQGQHAHYGATEMTAINTDQMPSHQHGGATDGQGQHNHLYQRSNQGTVAAYGQNVTLDSRTHFGEASPNTTDAGFHAHNIATDFRGGNLGHNHLINADGNHAHNVAVNIVPPYMSLCYIMRA